MRGNKCILRMAASAYPLHRINAVPKQPRGWNFLLPTASFIDLQFLVPSCLITTNSFCVQREKKVLVMPKLPVWSRPHYENLLGFVYDNNDQGKADWMRYRTRQLSARVPKISSLRTWRRLNFELSESDDQVGPYI